VLTLSVLSCSRAVLFCFVSERLACGLLSDEFSQLFSGEWPDCASPLSHYYCEWKKVKKK
jgi:hypothetical protein